MSGPLHGLRAARSRRVRPGGVLVVDGGATARYPNPDRTKGPLMADYATDLVAYHARVRPDSIAIETLETGEAVSWAVFEDHVARLASVLTTEFGVRQGDRVAVLAENDAMVLYVQFACFRIGAMFVPYSWRLAAPELEFCCKDIEPALLLHDRQYADLAHSLAAATGVPRVGGWGGGTDGSSRDCGSCSPATSRCGRADSTCSTTPPSSCTRPARPACRRRRSARTPRSSRTPPT